MRYAVFMAAVLAAIILLGPAPAKATPPSLLTAKGYAGSIEKAGYYRRYYRPGYGYYPPPSAYYPAPPLYGYYTPHRYRYWIPDRYRYYRPYY